MCAGCGCGDVNDVIIPGNKSGLGSGTSGKIVKQDPVHRGSYKPEPGESKRHEMSEAKRGEVEDD